MKARDRMWCVASLAAALAVSMAGLPSPARAEDNPALVSVQQSGAAAGACLYSRISATGRYVAFECAGANLVPGGTTAMPRIYVRDLLLGQAEAASVTSGEVLANGNSYDPWLSPDARFVVFRSVAANLLDGSSHLFVRDRIAGTTTLLAVEGLNWQLSDDGALAFTDEAQVIAEHVATGALETISVDDLGVPADAPARLGTRQCVSADARFVVFETTATNLAPGVSGAWLQVYVRDRVLGTTRLVSATPAGVPGDGSSLGESISADGRFVAFSSYSKNLGGLPPNARPQSWVRDLLTGGLELVSVSNSGQPSTDTSAFPSAWNTSISGDGRFVAFASTTNNLVPGLSGTNVVCVIRDRLAGLTYAASLDAQGLPQGGSDPQISRDGRRVSFTSTAALVPQDVNGLGNDVYRFDRLPWIEIEQGLAGTAGVPRLVMQGAPAAQAPILLAITRTLPGVMAHLVMGIGQVNVPFKGGVLVPTPSLVLSLPMNAQGLFVYETHWPAGIPAGTPLFLQAWVPDPAGPAGFAATNGVAQIAQ
ncbi:MAG TPA: hypothetical protein VFD43_10025 [Planctomycetota bacterium]|nr:hypothetical protein [Planctomycetota bacterium]